MTILVLSTSFPRWSGDWVGSFILKLTQHLAEKNEVNVLTPNFPGGKISDCFGSVPVLRFNYFLPRKLQRVIYPDGLPDQLKKSIFARLQLPFFIIKFIIDTVACEKKADILLCNWVATGVVAMMASFFSGKPYIVVVRGSDMKDIERKGFCSGLYVKALRNAAAVCSVAEDFIDSLKELGCKKVFFTPNGVDLEKFKLEKKSCLTIHEGRGKKPVILYVGTLIERKGLKYLLRAMRGINAKLIVIGEGYLQPDLEDLAGRNNLDIEFIGNVPTKAMPGWYEKADIFVLPSLYEGRPNVLIEALACGKACIATNIKGSRELIDNGVSGILVEHSNVEQLADKINMLLNNEELREKLMQNARDYLYKVVPGWVECSKNYEKILQDILSNL